MMSRASICSEIFMDPISEAILDPTLPARITHITEEENSSSRQSRTASPVTYLGSSGLLMFDFVWMVMAAPMKMEMMMSMRMESMPRLTISRVYCLKNIDQRSGSAQARFISKVYSPTLDIALIVLSL